MINGIDIGAVIVSLVAAAGSWAARRAQAKANLANTTIASRFDVEKDAYVRARQFDADTIARLTTENVQLRTENERLEQRCDALNARLNRRQQR